MSTNNSKVLFRHRDQLMIAGIQKNLAGLSSLTLGTGNLTPADAVTMLENRIAKIDASAQARAAYAAALKSERDEIANSRKAFAALKRLVEAMFFDRPELLADFGLKPVGRAQRTAAEVAAAVEQAKATRKARHTLGKKQKAKIKGVVTPETSPEPTA